jgi:hypothetical protein
MGSSAFEIILMPVLWGTFCGIVAGMAILAVMKAVEALVDRLGHWARSFKVVHRATCAAPRRTHRPAMRTGHPRGVYG